MSVDSHFDNSADLCCEAVLRMAVAEFANCDCKLPLLSYAIVVVTCQRVAGLLLAALMHLSTGQLTLTFASPRSLGEHYEFQVAFLTSHNQVCVQSTCAGILQA